MPFTPHVPAFQSSAVSLITLRNRLGAQKRPTISPDTVGIISSCYRKPALVFSFTRPTRACLKTYAKRPNRSSSLTFPLTLSKNSRFQTSAPVLLKRSLSFSLQLFRKFIYHTQTLTFGVIAALGADLGVSILSSGYTKRPLGIASPVHSCTYVSGRHCLYTYRALYTELPMHLIPIRALGP